MPDTEERLGPGFVELPFPRRVPIAEARRRVSDTLDEIDPDWRKLLAIVGQPRRMPPPALLAYAALLGVLLLKGALSNPTTTVFTAIAIIVIVLVALLRGSRAAWVISLAIEILALASALWEEDDDVLGLVVAGVSTLLLLSSRVRRYVWSGRPGGYSR